MSVGRMGGEKQEVTDLLVLFRPWKSTQQHLKCIRTSGSSRAKGRGMGQGWSRSQGSQVAQKLQDQG